MARDELIRHFYGGFVRLHILYHADKEAICGVEMIEELARHGYKLGPGTLYPMLHGLAESGYLVAEEQIIKGKRRKNYQITKRGRKLMADAQEKLRELFAEVIEPRDGMATAKKTRRLT